jgi:thiosulfate/3-mercaptopyruvate sulfurtransferase
MLRLTLAVIISAIFLTSLNAQHNAKSTANMLVQTDWLAAHLADKNLVILHVGADRTAYEAGHIPGARFLRLSDIAVTRNGIPNELPPMADLKATFEKLGIGDHSRVVLYGDMLGLFAARAYFTLDYLGRGNLAALLDGGLEKWSREHETVKTATVSATAGVLTVHPHPELIVELPALQKIVSNRTAILVDARPPMDYSGATPGEGIRRPGHIPGARSVFWAGMLVSRENPVFKSAVEIQSRYATVGLKPGGKAVVYCRTGIQAAHDYFTLKLTGFRPVLYDASFVEWSNVPETQVEAGSGGMN